MWILNGLLTSPCRGFCGGLEGRGPGFQFGHNLTHNDSASCVGSSDAHVSPPSALSLPVCGAGGLPWSLSLHSPPASSHHPQIPWFLPPSPNLGMQSQSRPSVESCRSGRKAPMEDESQSRSSVARSLMLSWLAIAVS